MSACWLRGQEHRRTELRAAVRAQATRDTLLAVPRPRLDAALTSLLAVEEHDGRNRVVPAPGAEIPADEQPVGPVSRIQVVRHVPVEGARESIGRRARLGEVEVRIARKQRIERPAHARDVVA